MDGYIAALLGHNAGLLPARWMVVKTALERGWCARCAMRCVGIARHSLYRRPYRDVLHGTLRAVAELEASTHAAPASPAPAMAPLQLPPDAASLPCVVCCGLLQDGAGVSIAYDQSATAQGSGGRSGAAREKKIDKRRARDAALALPAANTASPLTAAIGTKRGRDEDADDVGDAGAVGDGGAVGASPECAHAPAAGAGAGGGGVGAGHGVADTDAVVVAGLPWPLALILAVSGAHGGGGPEDASALQGCVHDMRCGIALHCSLPTTAAAREAAAK